MLRIELDAARADARLEALPSALAAALADKLDGLRAALAERVDANLTGAVLQTKSGALRDALASRLDVDDGSATAVVEMDEPPPYAAIQEFGGATRAHEIAPTKARALAFLVGGKRVFARSVRHPGSQIPERSYLRSALDDMSDDVVDALAAALQDGIDAS